MKTICPGKFAQIAAAVLSCVLLTAATARADEIKVVTSATFKPAYLELVPEYERATHDVLVTEYGPSMGATHNAIPVRLNRDEEIDVIIMAASRLDDLIKEGKVPSGKPGRLGPLEYRHGRQSRSAQARHQHPGCADEDVTRGKIDCVFR